MTLLSRIFGLFRDQAIQMTFGANAVTDAFWVAFRIPNFLRRLFAEGSFATAFVPVLTEVKETGTKAQLKDLVAATSGTLGGVLLVVTAFGVYFSPELARVFLARSNTNAAQFALLVNLMRLTFPFVFCISLTALAGGALNSFQRFAVPALTPVILNACMIAAALWLAPHLSVPITALGWAVLVGGGLQLLFQLPSLYRIGLLTRPRWGWKQTGVQKILRLMVPTLFGASIAQINLLLDTVIAAHLAAGSQSWLSLADRFLELPLGLFGVALGTVILPALARQHVKTDLHGFSSALDWGLRTTLLVAVPAMVSLWILARPLITTLFEYGNFHPFDTQMTALSVYGLSLGLPAFALLKVILPAFYARQDTKTPVHAGIAALLANIVLNFLILAVLYAIDVPPALDHQGILTALRRQPGLHLALGIASALSSYLNLGLLWYRLCRSGSYQRQPQWPRFLIRLLISCAVLAGLLGLAVSCLPDFSSLSRWMRLGYLLGLVGLGGVSFIGCQVMLGFRWHHLRCDVA